MDYIKEYIKHNNFSLFKTHSENILLAQFDSRGFHFTDEANKSYSQIKNQPHLYVAFGTKALYIGKSFQAGGRWKRAHYYHLGILAHEVLKTCNPKDQHHGHWIDAWMYRESFTVGSNCNSIVLKQDVRISFIPFNVYSDIEFNILSKDNIKEINKSFEKQLIKSFQNGEDDINLLNIQNNN